jgi:hypothetical protein
MRSINEMAVRALRPAIVVIACDRQDQFGCVLDLSVLRRSGGNLVVETEIGGNARNFGVHWAGGCTSDNTANCGGNVDLIIDRRDLDILALSAGGYGIGRKRMPLPTGDVGN